MKRIAVVVVMVLMLTTVAVGTASANWWFDLVCVDNPTGPPPGQIFQVVYHEDAADTDDFNTVNVMWLTPEGPAVGDVTITQPAAGAFGTAMGWMNMPGSYSDTGAGLTINMMHFGVANPADGDILANISYVAPPGGTVIWDELNGGFVCDINGTPLSGAVLYASNNLYLNGAPAFPPGSPAPPIPEIVTIVLISIGLISLGAYVWYRRRNQQAVLAA